MKNKLIYKIGLLLMIVSFINCESVIEDELFVIGEKINSGSSDGSSGACPVGKWASPTCNGNKSLIYFFGSNGEGYSENPECTNQCSGPIIFRFRYTISGDKITYNFTGTESVTCNGSTSKPPTPSGTFTITFRCSGNQLITETSNTQTGARTTVTFTKV